MTAILLVAIGAAVGAPTRFLTDRWVQSRHDSVFPWGTFGVNAVGSFVLGAVVAAAAAGSLPDALTHALGIGFCGALTTYSTFSFETIRLVETGSLRYAAGNVVLSLAAGLLAALAGAGLADLALG